MVSFNRVEVKRNYEGAKTFRANDFTDLYLKTATQMVMEQRFYGDKNEQFNDWIACINKVAVNYPDFVLKLASYTRNKLKLRTAPIIMLVEVALANPQKNGRLVKEYAPKIIQRADEMSEIIAYYIAKRGNIGKDTPGTNGLPNLLKTVINKELLGDKFTPYQLIKNDSNKSAVKLRDVLRITHPKVTDDQTRELFRKIVKQESMAEISEQTWEGYIAKHGSRRETWEAILPKMPIFAVLRNLRNFIENDVSETHIHHHVESKLRSPEHITKSKILPFRFYQAWKEIDKVSPGNSRQMKTKNIILNSLKAAVKFSVPNIPDLGGVTVIAVDTSGSMSYHTISKLSDTHPIEIGSLFGCLLHERLGDQRSKMVAYDTHAEIFNYNIEQGIMENVQALSARGGNTHAHLVPSLLIRKGIRADRIIFLTDEETYGGSLQHTMQDYRKTVNPDCVAYTINLMGYGHCQLDPNNPINVNIGGYSERVFDLISSIENRNIVAEIGHE